MKNLIKYKDTFCASNIYSERRLADHKATRQLRLYLETVWSHSYIDNEQAVRIGCEKKQETEKHVTKRNVTFYIIMCGWGDEGRWWVIYMRSHRRVDAYDILWHVLFYAVAKLSMAALFLLKTLQGVNAH